MNVFGQLKKACFEILSSQPASSVQGRVWFNSTTGKNEFDNGTQKRALLANDDKAVIGNSGTASDNTRLHRGGVGVLQFVPGDDVTAEGSPATNINQIAGRAENYLDAGKPAFGNAGRLIYLTDQGVVQYDTGTSWESLSAGAVSFPTGNLVISGATTLVAGDNKKILKITAQAGGYNITLPPHSANQMFWFKEVSKADVVANPITLVRDGGTGNVEGVSSSYVIRQNNFSFGLFDDGTDWWIL